MSDKKKVAIIGYGYVGKAMHKIFPDALVYDPALFITDNDGNKNKLDVNGVNVASENEINEKCSLAIVCVPTPPKGMREQRVRDDEDEFLEADLGIVKDTISWLDTPLILIKSTIPPGTTDRLIHIYDTQKICFSPEYIGEGKYYVPPKYPDPEDPRKHDFMIIGGEEKVCDEILAYFIERLGPAKTYFKCSAVEAECVKYMENTWGAMKVTFCNEWFEMCQRFGASYNTVREGWLLDSRVERMHTAVFTGKRGFGGKCYPKDLLGIIATAEGCGYEPKLLKQIWNTNKEMLKKNK